MTGRETPVELWPARRRALLDGFLERNPRLSRARVDAKPPSCPVALSVLTHSCDRRCGDGVLRGHPFERPTLFRSWVRGRERLTVVYHPLCPVGCGCGKRALRAIGKAMAGYVKPSRGDRLAMPELWYGPRGSSWSWTGASGESRRLMALCGDGERIAFARRRSGRG